VLAAVAHASNEPEAVLIRGVLGQAGIPCILSGDLPGFGAAGPRDVYVEQEHVERARAALDEAGL
jgi:hypothetical protein